MASCDGTTTLSYTCVTFKSCDAGSNDCVVAMPMQVRLQAQQAAYLQQQQQQRLAAEAAQREDGDRDSAQDASADGMPAAGTAHGSETGPADQQDVIAADLPQGVRRDCCAHAFGGVVSMMDYRELAADDPFC